MSRFGAYAGKKGDATMVVIKDKASTVKGKVEQKPWAQRLASKFRKNKAPSQEVEEHEEPGSLIEEKPVEYKKSTEPMGEESTKK